MSRFSALDPASTQGKTHDTLAGIDKMLGMTPNLYRTAAQAPSVLDGMVGLAGATAHGTLRPAVREAIALAVAEANGCDYCLSAHTVLGKGAGLTEGAVAAARSGESSDGKTNAILRFARSLTLGRGRVSDTELAALRQAGASDAEILEVIANVTLNIFTNYVNLVADTEIDFPVVRAGKAA